MTAANLQFRYRHQRLELKSQGQLTLFLGQAKALEIRTRQTEAPARHLIGYQWPRQGIITVHHDLAYTTENPVFGQVIAGQAVVAVHVVFADIQHSGHLSIQLRSGFQLKARQLKHIELNLVVQQIQRRSAQIATHGYPLAGSLGHITDQGSDSAFRVRAGNGDYRRLGGPSKEFDIADNTDPGGLGGQECWR